MVPAGRTAKPQCSGSNTSKAAALPQHRVWSFLVGVVVFSVLYLMVSGAILHAAIRWYDALGIRPELMTLIQLGSCVLLGALLSPAAGYLIPKQYLKCYAAFLAFLTLASLAAGWLALRLYPDWLLIFRYFPQLLSVAFVIPAEIIHLLLLFKLLK